MEAQLPLLALVQKYFDNSPVAAAHLLETLTEKEAAQVLEALPAETATEAVRHLNEPFAADVLKMIPPDLVKEVISGLESERGANILLHLPADMRGDFLSGLESRKRRQIKELLTYPEGSAGRIMTTELLVFHSDVIVKDAVQKIRLLAQKNYPQSYVYVVNEEDHLVGVMNMRDMLLTEENTPLDSVMRRGVFTVDSFTDRETIADMLSSQRLFAVPVVDGQQKLLGVVRAEQLIGDVQEEATEDIQKMFGAGGDERVFSPIRFSLRKRLPWLHVNLLTVFVAASVVALFEDVIAKITVLAVFLPVVAGQGGNAGAQSLAVVMRGMVMREIPPQKVKQLILKETSVGLINGLVIGTVTAVVAWIWNGNPFLGLVIGLGMLVTLIVAGLSGAVIPIAMKALRLDPAQCSGIILTTITDVVGFFTFLGFAALFQAYLL